MASRLENRHIDRGQVDVGHGLLLLSRSLALAVSLPKGLLLLSLFNSASAFAAVPSQRQQLQLLRICTRL